MALIDSPVLVFTILSFLVKALPEHAIPALLFGGKIQDQHKSKFAFKELVDRYKASIDDLNTALTLSVGLAVIALYAYFSLPVSGEVSVPFSQDISSALDSRCAGNCVCIASLRVYIVYMVYAAAHWLAAYIE